MKAREIRQPAIILGVLALLLTLATSFGWRLRHASLMDDAWNTEYQAGVNAARGHNYEDAIARFTASSQIAASFAENDPRLESSLTELSDAYAAQGLHLDAEAALLRVLGIQVKAHGPISVAAARTLHSLGTFYLAQGQLPNAEGMFAQALSIWESTATVSPEAEQNRMALAQVLRAQGRTTDAQNLMAPTPATAH